MYEWNETKNNSNLKKHSLDFNLAIEVFSDPNGIMQLNHNIDGEERSQIIGKLQNEIIIVFVVFTQRRQKIRIISARKANKKERQIYENQARAN